MRVKDDVSLTWDDNRRILGLNPIVRPEVDNVLGHYVPFEPLQGWQREGFQDSLDKALGWIVFLSRSKTLVGGLRIHVGNEERLNGVCGQGRSIQNPALEFKVWKCGWSRAVVGNESGRAIHAGGSVKIPEDPDSGHLHSSPDVVRPAYCDRHCYRPRPGHWGLPFHHAFRAIREWVSG